MQNVSKLFSQSMKGSAYVKKSLTELKERAASQGVDLSLLDPVIDKYGAIEGSMISILQHTQDIYGYVPVSAIDYISQKTGIFASTIYGVTTFYAQFRLHPVGKHLIMLCQGTACHVNGSAKMEEVISEELGIKDGETTEDGIFTLNNVACLGCCSLAPVMMIDGEAYGSLTPDRARKILAEIADKAKEGVTA